MLVDTVLDAVGETPLVRLQRLFARCGTEVLVKLEGYNPAGSSKDRPAVAMLRGALADGRIAGGSLVIEASSGNTGVALAKACAVLGLRFRCLVDPGTTRANLAIMRAYGAEVEMIDTPDADGEYLPPKRSRIRDILAHDASAFWPDQYANPANPESHAQGTIREILNELGRAPDALFVATSTCGTLRGCMETLKAEGAPTRVWAVDAAGSQIFRDRPRPRRIPGLGSSLQPDFAPSVSDVEVVHVETTDCVVACRRLAAEEGILAGGSSGAVVHAIGRHIGDIPPGSVCVGILPDRGDRYLDTVYDDDWLPGRAAVDREVRGG